MTTDTTEVLSDSALEELNQDELSDIIERAHQAKKDLRVKTVERKAELLAELKGMRIRRSNRTAAAEATEERPRKSGKKKKRNRE